MIADPCAPRLAPRTASSIHVRYHTHTDTQHWLDRDGPARCITMYDTPPSCRAEPSSTAEMSESWTFEWALGGEVQRLLFSSFYLLAPLLYASAPSALHFDLRPPTKLHRITGAGYFALPPFRRPARHSDSLQALAYIATDQ